jgi:hypothetical protein
MALNCQTCGNKQNAVSQGHCTEFQHIPDIDACGMHTGGIHASSPEVKNQTPTIPQKSTDSYLWLNQSHPNGQVKLIDQSTVK